MIPSVIAQINIGQQFKPAQTFNSIGSLLNIIVPNLFLGAGFILFVGIIITGLKFLTGGPNPENMKKTKAGLTYAIVGFAIIIFSYLLIKLLGTILNINFFI
jgi:hypothetical protein